MNTKSKLSLLTLAICTCAAGLTGCSSAAVQTTDSGPNKGKTNVEKQTAEKPDKYPISPTNRDVPDITAPGDKIGVAECDDYIQKYEACLTKNVPEQARGMMKTSFDQTRKTWKELAADQDTKNSLAAVCKQSKDAAKQATAAYHCDW